MEGCTFFHWISWTGIEADEAFFKKLQDGFRMDKPRGAPNAVYQLMANCWRLEPEDRPTFAELEVTLGQHLSASVRQEYVDLNQAYVDANAHSKINDSPDYMNMTAAVDVHDQRQPFVSENDSDYLRMRVEEEQPNRVSALDLTGYLFMGHSSTGCNQSPSAVEESELADTAV